MTCLPRPQPACNMHRSKQRSSPRSATVIHSMTWRKGSWTRNFIKILLKFFSVYWNSIDFNWFQLIILFSHTFCDFKILSFLSWRASSLRLRLPTARSSKCRVRCLEGCGLCPCPESCTSERKKRWHAIDIFTYLYILHYIRYIII